jgi:hypothetical protein
MCHPVKVIYKDKMQQVPTPFTTSPEVIRKKRSDGMCIFNAKNDLLLHVTK